MKTQIDYFKEKQIPHYSPSQQTSKLAISSIIQKKKIQGTIYHTLLCYNHQQKLTHTEQQLRENQRKKYLEFIRKTYSQKIPQELKSQSKLKEALKINQEKNKSKLIEKKNKKVQSQPKTNKKRTNKIPIEQIDKPKKKNKLNGQSKSNLNEQDRKSNNKSQHPQEIAQQFESESVNLVNSSLEHESQNQQYEHDE